MQFEAKYWGKVGVGSTNSELIVAELALYPTCFFVEMTLYICSGMNNYQFRPISYSDGGKLMFYRPFPYPIEVGADYIIGRD